MKHTIYTQDNQSTDMAFDTIEEAEAKLLDCPPGYWIDTWMYDHYEELRKRLEDYSNFD